MSRDFFKCRTLNSEVDDSRHFFKSLQDQPCIVLFFCLFSGVRLKLNELFQVAQLHYVFTKSKKRILSKNKKNEGSSGLCMLDRSEDLDLMLNE